MNESMIERVAAAMNKAILQWNIDNEGYGGSVNVECPLDVQARAAIEAMREPTNDMATAAYGLAGSNQGSCQAEIDVYQTMIDAALA